MAFSAANTLTSPEIEQEVLGAILTKPDKIYELSGALRPSDFYREAHKAVYRVMLSMAERRLPIEIQSLTEISIHAPAWGATRPSDAIKKIP